MVDIYNKNGVLLTSVVVDDDSYRYREIMGQARVVLSFSLPQCIDFPVGSFTRYDGVKYTLLDRADITVVHLREYEYSLTLYSGIAKASSYVLFEPVSGLLKFDYTGSTAEHAQLFVDNMNAREGNGTFLNGHPVGPYSVGETTVALDDITEITKLISYNHSSCIDCLNNIASVFETEWEIVESIDEEDVEHFVVNIGKVEKNTANPLSLGYGYAKGIKSGFQRSMSSESRPIGKLYVQGGERNIDLSTYGNSSLLLPRPNGQSLTFNFDGKYFGWETEYQTEGRVGVSMKTGDDGRFVELVNPVSNAEASLSNSESYPKRVGTITEVREFASGEADEQGNSYKFINIYDYELAQQQQAYGNTPIFQQITGEQFTVIFQGHNYETYPISATIPYAGNLIGREIGIAAYLKESGGFELMQENIDGQIMPTDLEHPQYCPAVGDTYAVFGCKLPDIYIADHTNHSGGEYDLLREAAKYLYEHKDYRYTLRGDIDDKWAKRRWTDGVHDKDTEICLGGKVLYKNSQMFSDLTNGEYLTRITGIKDLINYPYQIELTISDEDIRQSVGDVLRQLGDNKAHVDVVQKQSELFTKRSFKQAKELIAALEGAIEGFSEGINPVTVSTMAMLVGSEQLQFKFFDSTFTSIVQSPFTIGTSGISTSEAIGLRHYTLGVNNSTITTDAGKSSISYHQWVLPSQNVTTDKDGNALKDDSVYYLYAKCSATSDIGGGQFILSLIPVSLRPLVDGTEGNYYYFLIGVISSVSTEDETPYRAWAPLYGYTEILPNQIRTDAIASTDGKTSFNLANGVISLNDNAGISGNNTESNIAAWFGGGRVDKTTSPQATDAAKSLLRFDGTGYFAGGNISWDTDGDGSVAGGLISWETVNGEVKVTINGNTSLGGQKTVTEVLESQFFELDAEQYVRLKSEYNGLYTQSGQSISAGGIGSGGGGGSSSCSWGTITPGVSAVLTVNGTPETLSLNGHTHSYNNLTDKPTIPSTEGFVDTTSAQTVSGKKTLTGGLEVKGIDIWDETDEAYYPIAEWYSPIGHTHAYSTITGTPDLSTKQDVISDLSTIRSGASAGATAYQKPSGGIPKTDLSSSVQASLGKADTALQTHQSLDNYYTKDEIDDMIGEIATLLNGLR